MWWNIRWLPGGHPTKATPEDADKQMASVKSFFKKHLPEIALLCEIRDLDTLQKLELDYTSIACTAIPRTEDENSSLPMQSMAIMSKLPWKEIWALDFSELPLTADKPSRGMLGALVEIPGFGPVTLYAAHFKSNRGGIEASSIRRERTVEYFKWELDRRKIDPKKDFIVFAGDFNTSFRDRPFADDKTLKKIASLGFRLTSEGMTHEESHTVHPSKRYPGNDFDHIFVSEALAAKISEPPPWGRIEPTSDDISDHKPIFFPLGELAK